MLEIDDLLLQAWRKRPAHQALKLNRSGGINPLCLRLEIKAPGLLSDVKLHR